MRDAKEALFRHSAFVIRHDRLREQPAWEAALMRQFRLIVFALALIVFAGVSLIGKQGPAAVAGSPFDALHFRAIGPAGMSGRIADIAVYEANPNIFYVASAHGGVWKTVNNGTTFEAQLQNQGLMSIGDVAVSQSNPDLVWAGTGESNNRQSGSWGDGAYKSTDGGKTWTNMGLRTSRHINRIVIDPRNNDTVFVAATGSLWGPGGERGVYKTSDGGRTWKQSLKVDDDTGANDLVMDPSNSQVLYASTYQRRRTACCMNGGGPGSGIWKSTDGGEHWTRLKSGLPEGSLGRIALDVYRRRPNILYSLIEGPVEGGRGGRGAQGAGEPGAQPARGAQGAPAATEETPGAGQGQFGGRGGVVQGVGPGATGLYRSDDAGATWRKVNNENARPMYFSQVRVDPNDPDVVLMGGVKLHQTTDGGKTISTNVSANAHDDVHAIWIDPSNSNHVIIGDDGGLAVSWDMAKTWVFVPNLPVGLFYHVSFDLATPFNVCGGMQDNYDWCGPSQVRSAAGIANHEWNTVQGGDGFVVLQDPQDARVIYSESQDGNIVRVDRVTNESMTIRPVPGAKEPALRWHWDTPLVLSPHDARVVYAAANRVFRSPDRGLSWTPISPDLTSGADREETATMGVKGKDVNIAKNDGIVAWPTVVAFAESPRRAGLLYAGTDDGNLQVSRDAGKTWTNVISKIAGLPQGVFVSRVAPSRFDEGTVYATFDGHRQNDFETHIFASRDFGQTWTSIAGNISGEVARTITEDLKNADVLYLGTETGLFITIDRGKSWTHVKGNFPTVRLDEITLHPRDNAMLLATHGRAIWILDHLEPIQEFAAAQQTEAKLFTPAPSVMYRRPARDRNYEFWGDQTFFGENPPQAAVISWSMKNPANEVKLRITDAGGREVREISGPVLANSVKPGIQSACWDLRVQPIPQPAQGGRGGQGGRGAQGGPPQGAPATAPQSSFGAGCAQPAGGFGGFGGGATNAGPFVLPAVYNVSLIVDGKTIDTKPVRVMADPEVLLTEAQRRQMFDMAMDVHELQRGAADGSSAISSLTRQLTDLSGGMDSRTDIPADVKGSIDALQKELATFAAKLTPPAGGRGFGGGGRGGANDNVAVRLAAAKNVLTGGMWPTEQSLRAFNDAKAELPRVVADLNAAIGRASTLSVALAKYNLTLTVPAPVKLADTNGRKRTN
jgi:photosystem II stability/assembly factor-like uncharacterized protein